MSIPGSQRMIPGRWYLDLFFLRINQDWRFPLNTTLLQGILTTKILTFIDSTAWILMFIVNHLLCSSATPRPRSSPVHKKYHNLLGKLLTNWLETLQGMNTFHFGYCMRVLCSITYGSNSQLCTQAIKEFHKVCCGYSYSPERLESRLH